MDDRDHEAAAGRLVDGFGRAIGDLRLSVTDRCNLRCVYCIPEEDPEWQAREKILTFEEIHRVAAVFAGVGVRKLRLTGGEPLLRRDMPDLVRALASVEGVTDIAMTTNGLLLERHLDELIDAGLDRVNISLDTLREERFRQMTRREGLQAVLSAIEAAAASDLSAVKVNVVLMRGLNDDEVEDFGAFCRDSGLVVRFIEFMPLEAGDVWSRASLVPGREVFDRLHAWGGLESIDRDTPAETAERFRFADGGGEIGIISSVTRPFCGDCNRARVTAEGKLRTCLFAHEETDLRGLLRGGADDAEIEARIRAAWKAKEPGHLVNSGEFRRPERTMSAIGG